MRNRPRQLSRPEANSGRVEKLQKILIEIFQVSGREELVIGANQIRVTKANVQNPENFTIWLNTYWNQSNGAYQEKRTSMIESIRDLESKRLNTSAEKQEIDRLALERCLLDMAGPTFSVAKLLKNLRRGELTKIMALLGTKNVVTVQKTKDEKVTYSDQDILEKWGTWHPRVRDKITGALKLSSRKKS